MVCVFPPQTYFETHLVCFTTSFAVCVSGKVVALSSQGL